jgi:hypothetical protein
MSGMSGMERSARRTLLHSKQADCQLHDAVERMHGTGEATGTTALSGERRSRRGKRGRRGRRGQE